MLKYKKYKYKNTLYTTTLKGGIFTVFYCNEVFKGCTKLTSIIYTGTIDQFKIISDSVLKDIKGNSGLTITCTDGKYDADLNKIS